MKTRLFKSYALNLFVIVLLCFIQSTYGQIATHGVSQLKDSVVRYRSLANDDYRSVMPNYIPASPTVSSLMSFVDYPVSYYTGIPNISIPLYEIEIDGYKLPISISYHASGIKISQEASWVGLGWSLNIGGVISRAIKCYDDFLEYPQPAGSVKYGYYNGPEANNPYSDEYYTNTADGSYIKNRLVIDSEPDIFTYSLPGAGGKFVIDKTRGAALFDKSINLKIEILSRNQKKYFKVVAPDGTEYIFDRYETTRSYSRQGSLNRNLNNATKFDESDLNLYDSPFIFTSSWYLTKIITATNRVINFTYADESYSAPVQEKCVKYNSIFQGGNSMCGPGNNIVYSCSKTVIENLRLSQISWDGGRIEFNCSSREDMIGTNNSLMPQKLNTMKVYNNDGSCIKSYQFNYDYFNAKYSKNYKHVFKRLKLIGFQNSLDENDNYSFTYIEGDLPAKNSNNTDYWGYYNGSSQGSEYYCTADYGGKIYKGADKTTRLSYMSIGSLKGIRYPTGALSQFAYEANCYMPTIATSTTIQKVDGGLSVYQYYSDDACAHMPEYQADTLVIDYNTAFVVQGYADNMSCTRDPDIRYNDGENYPSFKISKLNSAGDKKMLFSYPVPPELEYDACSCDFEKKELYLTTGTYIVEAFGQAKDVLFGFSYQYEKKITTVNKETPAGGLRIAKITDGEKVRTFKYPLGELLIEPVVFYMSDYTCFNGTAYNDWTSYLVQVSESTIPLWTFKDGNSIGYTFVTETVKGGGKTVYNYFNEREESEGDYPFMPTRINYYNGLPRSIQYYKNESLAKSVTYEYSAINSRPIYGFVYNSIGGDTHGYQYNIEWLLKSKEIIVDYENNGSILTENEYAYNDNLQLKTESTNVCGNRYRKELVYPSDLNDDVSKSMTNKHIINKPVELVAFKNGKVVKGKRTVFKDTLNMFVPEVEQVLETVNPLSKDEYKNFYSTRLVFDNYNKWGKPMQVSDRNISVVYLWGYNGMYPIAEIKNSSYQEVKQILTAGFIQDLAQKSIPTAIDIGKINALRKSLPHAFITTFTYSPLVGVKSTTNLNGYTTYYTYNSLGQLVESYFIKNSSKQILRKYDYHYYDK